MVNVDMPLYDSNMCSVCFYDLGTFRYCCDSGDAHRPILCPDCKCELMAEGKAKATKPVSRFCTVTGKLHDDQSGLVKNATLQDIEAEKCLFCGYEKSAHGWCTETGWKHSEMVEKFNSIKNATKPVIKPSTKQNTAPPGLLPDSKKIRVSANSGLPPTVPPTSPASPPPVKQAISKPPTSPAPKELYSDGSFLMSGITPNMKILFIGEGNFSFSRTIGNRVFGDERPWKNMVATDLELLAGPNNPGHQLTTANAIELLKRGATVTIGIDATKVISTLPFFQKGTFDLVTFQFPHNADKNFPFYPFPKGVPLESVGQHREMLSEFLKQACGMLREGGKACITTKTSEPYKSWEVDMLAEPPMWFTKGDVFDQARWAQLGYSHINTVNKCNTSIDGAVTYIFTKDSSGCPEPDNTGTFRGFN
eukprot:TRINITY_DN1974_c0_g1_i2.p1 TRINITY_DN1974_c0_g1~~TRINITY_DN1974_c0_g1_i2.p1  ORF type:complete len:421 (+),score=53.14 TRINITY_DN1974_c0_g1_i2:136-1398(+)